MYGTTTPAELASRLLNVYPERDCEQGRANPPSEIGLAPFYPWSCQSEASGECYSTPEQIQSFGLSSAAMTAEMYGEKCWKMEARGPAAQLSPERVLVAIVSFAVLAGLVL